MPYSILLTSTCFRSDLRTELWALDEFGMLVRAARHCVPDQFIAYLEQDYLYDISRYSEISFLLPYLTNLGYVKIYIKYVFCIGLGMDMPSD